MREEWRYVPEYPCYAVSNTGTGQSVPTDAGEYLSTVQDGYYVWHVYIRGGI